MAKKKGSISVKPKSDTPTTDGQIIQWNPFSNLYQSSTPTVRVEYARALERALRNLLKQIDDHCALEGEGNFYTGGAHKVLRGEY